MADISLCSGRPSMARSPPSRDHRRSNSSAKEALALSPIVTHSLLRKTTSCGAISSFNVQPRVNQSLLWKTFDESCIVEEDGGPVTSSRYARHTYASEYHLYIELMASESSVLLVLSMQQVSIHSQSKTGYFHRLTASQKHFTFKYPARKYSSFVIGLDD